MSTGKSQESSVAGALKSFGLRYVSWLEQYPLPTKMVTSSLIAGMGDFTSQALTAGSFEALKSDFSSWRTFKFSMVGFFYTAPLLHQWFAFLVSRFPQQNMVTVLKRLFMDQFVATPVFVASFFTVMMTVEGKTGLIISKLQQDYWTTLKSNWMVWIPASFINFTFVPVTLQVLYANTIGFFWTIYLSSMANRKIEDAEFKDTHRDQK